MQSKNDAKIQDIFIKNCRLVACTPSLKTTSSFATFAVPPESVKLINGFSIPQARFKDIIQSTPRAWKQCYQVRTVIHVHFIIYVCHTLKILLVLQIINKWNYSISSLLVAVAEVQDVLFYHLAHLKFTYPTAHDLFNFRGI